MRMWMVDPKEMCDPHLNGEHLELHMFVGSIRKGRSVAGFVAKGLLDTAKLKERHEAVVEEMTKRGFIHKSPLDYDDELKLGSVDVKESRKELMSRCVTCRSQSKRAKAGW